MFVRRPIVAESVVGKSRVDARTKRLIKRLNPGEIAIINHGDVDRVAAEALISTHPAAVVNAADSVTGRYPSVGALLIARAGIPLIDGAGDAVMEIQEGSLIQVENGQVFSDGQLVATGVVQSESSLLLLVEKAKEGLSVELQAFAQNTLSYIAEESHLLFDPPDPPKLRTVLRGRHVMVVVRGHDYKEDLLHLRSYVRDMRPVVIAVDGGADICLEHGLTPDIIIGDFDSVTDGALLCGAELVVHAYVGGDAPGGSRLDELGVPYIRYEAPGMSEDVAMLLAYDEGAELIVAVGTHSSMVEFLDKGRAGMASTFLARLKVGSRLVDAKGVSRLYQGTVRTSDLGFLVAAALVAFLVMALVLEPFRTFLSGTWFLITGFFGEIFRAVTPW